MADALLRLEGVSRSFGGLAAVQDVSLALPAGTLGADLARGRMHDHAAGVQILGPRWRDGQRLAAEQT